MKRTIVRAIALTALISAALTASSLAAEFRAAWAPTPPAIDGNASAGVWNAGTLLAFKSSDDDSTAVRLLEDGRYLYVAVHAAQRERIAAHALQDGATLEADDTISLQFQSGSEVLSFRVNPFGAHQTASSAPAAFAPAWNSAGRILNDTYEITMRIPRDVFQGHGMPWKLTVSRSVAALRKSTFSQTVAFDSDPANAAFHAARIVAGAQGKFIDAYSALWPSAAIAPAVPQSSSGVAVKSSVGSGVTLVALDAHTATRDDNAQAIAFRSDDNRLSATISRAEATDAEVHDTEHGISLDYDDRAGTSAGVYWSAIGDDAGAGSTSISGNAKRDFGAFSVEGSAQSSRDELGTMLNAGEQAKVAVAIGSNVNVGLDTQTNYDDAIGSFSENGIALSYNAGESEADLSYRAGHYEAGFLQDARIAAVMKVAALGSLRIEHRQGNFYSGFAAAMQQSTSVGIRRASRSGSIGVSYQYVSGALPQFLRQASQSGGRISVSLDRYLSGGLLHFNFNQASTALATQPSFTVKFVPGVAY